VLTERGIPVMAEKLSPGESLVPCSALDTPPVVCSVKHLPCRDQDVVLIKYLDADQQLGILKVTASHVILVRSRHTAPYLPRLARDLQVNDQLKTLIGSATITGLDLTTQHTAAVQVVLAKATEGLLAAHEGAPIAVFGAESPPASCWVKILSYTRHDSFRQILLESEEDELQICRDNMEQEGFCADLSKLRDVGSGKMFISTDLAQATVLHLYTRARPLRKSDIVVCQKYELVVKSAIERHPGRKPRLIYEEIVDLSEQIAHMHDAEVSKHSSVVHGSCTDVSSVIDVRTRSTNPRVVHRKYLASDCNRNWG